eukprot:GGOE01053197.1.p1 GENE.GGOE01053197.1~~GGOE01053197.1.p1  ORF type:complete len:515 (+),score=186.99 GGOE01053197.1:799-2343(+)
MGHGITEHPAPTSEKLSFGRLLQLLLNPFDARFEDLWMPGTTLPQQVAHDFIAGLIIATIAIPVAMGFAIASGLHPVQGIVGGAVAGGLGALVGGSKYQVYGPTAAFIPLIANIIHEFSGGDPERYFYAHGCLVFCSCIAGVLILILGLLQLGSYVEKVPHSIVVGFTIGIAATIFLSEVPDMVGVYPEHSHSSLGKIGEIAARHEEVNFYCLFLGVMTFVVTKAVVRISVFIPGPIVSIALGTFLTEYVWPDKGIVRVVDRFGPIPTDLLRFTPPVVPDNHYGMLAKAVVSIVLVSVIESLLCSRLADKLANNDRHPFHPNKELWGQGWVQVVVPMLNGFPHTGALARTATNVKVGAVSPLSGLFKCILKLLLAYLTTPVLNIIPMACVGGILAYVAVNMVKAEEVAAVMKMRDPAAVAVMVVTGLVVLGEDFLTGIAAGVLLHLLVDITRSTDPKAVAAAEVVGPQSHLLGNNTCRGTRESLAISMEAESQESRSGSVDIEAVQIKRGGLVV